MSAYAAENWSDFAVAVAGAAAALAGLLFVALSINLAAILASDRLPSRAAHTLALLAIPLILAIILLIPEQSEHILGAEILVLGVLSAGWLGWLDQPRKRPPEQSLGQWIMSTAVPAWVLVVALVVAGTGMLTHSMGGLYWVAVAVIAGFYGGLLNAWVLLVEILR